MKVDAQKPQTKKYRFIPMLPEELCVGVEYWSNAEGAAPRFTRFTVRERYYFNKSIGIYSTETEQAYMEYREDLHRWAKNGWLYKRVIDLTGAEEIKGAAKVKEQVKVSVKADKSIKDMFNELTAPKLF